MDPSPLYGIGCQTGVVWLAVNKWGGVENEAYSGCLAKHVFQVHGVDCVERSVWCKRLKRDRWIEEIEQNV
jgi:hypothetical protein